MYKKELGFVLKRFLPNKNKISILTQTLGKIEIILRPTERTSQLWPGMLLAFYPLVQNKQWSTGNKIFFAQNLEIMMFPYYNNVLSMEWIHQLLEICYYFSPLHNPANEIFRHLYNSFNIEVLKKHFNNELFIIKKIYIIKLLELLGFYPKKDLIIYLSLYQELCSMYIDYLDKDKAKLLKNNLQKVETIQIEKMDNWIKESLSSHPNFKFFKTLYINY